MKKTKKLTKKKLASMARTAKRKKWKEVAASVRQRDGNVCAVCKLPHEKLNIHHLIPREVKQYMFEPMNLITLCPRHHKFSYFHSFHRDPWFSIYWMQKYRIEQYTWVMDKMAELENTLMDFQKSLPANE